MDTVAYAVLTEFVLSELEELESRDIDRLHECIMENLKEMGYPCDDEYLNAVYVILEKNL